MNPGIYKLIHFLGMIVLFGGIGALLTADLKNPAKRKIPAILHGLGLFLILLSGFGLQAKLGLGFPVWLIVKVAVWFLLGAFIMVAKRELLPAPVAWVIVTILGFTAAYLGFANSILLRFS